MAQAAPLIALAVTAVATGVSVYSSVQQGKQARAAAAYQEAVARNNKIYAERAAQDAEARGKQQEEQQRIQTQQMIGRQRAALASNGVLVDEGTSLDLIGDTAMFGELDALNIRGNAQREALGYRQAGSNFDQQAYLASQSGRGYGWDVAGTALGGAGSVASKWYDFNKAGAFDGLFGSQTTEYGALGYYGSGALPTSQNTGMISGGI